MNDLTEEQIEQLLRTADRPRALGDDELRRIERRLHPHRHDPARPQVTEIVPLPVSTGRGGVRRRWRTGPLVGACAAAIVAVFVVALAMLGRPPASSPVEAPPTTPLSPAAWCATHVDAVTDAVERWRGVENWAWATDGIPDLGELVETALRELHAPTDQDATDQARAAATELRSQLDNAAASTDSGAAAEQRLNAINAALDSLSTIGGTVDPACPFENLAAARGS